MTLSAMRDFIRERRQVSVKDAARHFGTDPSAVEPLMDYWVSKGNVLRRTGDVFSSACCGKCGGKGHLWYQWDELSVL